MQSVRAVVAGARVGCFGASSLGHAKLIEQCIKVAAVFDKRICGGTAFGQLV
jgi:hypothetical protein